MSEEKKRRGAQGRFSDPELARQAGIASAANRTTAARKRKHNLPPLTIDFLDLMDECKLIGPTWERWRVWAGAVFALDLARVTKNVPAAFQIYQEHTKRSTWPTTPFPEAFNCVGRRAGKSTIKALVALFQAMRTDPSTFAKPGEKITVPLIARDRKQVGVLLGHVRSFVRASSTVRKYVVSEFSDTVEIATGVTVEVQTASFRSTRGYTSCAVVADEVAYWSIEGANPADDILDALRPTLGNVPNALLVVSSNPYTAAGPLHQAVADYFGKDDPDCLVWMSDTTTMRPGFDQRIIARAFKKDSVKAASEYGEPHSRTVQFRQSSQALFDLDPIVAAIVQGRRELLPVEGVRYHAYIDAAQGGRSGDNMALAIAHYDSMIGRAVLDAAREIEPPFDPVAVLTRDFAPVFATYGITQVRGDQVAKGFVASTLLSLGLAFDLSTLDTSATYIQLLGVVNSAGVELLDDPTLRLQLLSLQRTPGTNGRDKVTHPSGSHDDRATAAAGALMQAVGLASGKGDGQTYPFVFGGQGDHVGIAAYAAAPSPPPPPEERTPETMQAWRDAERARSFLRARETIAPYARRVSRRSAIFSITRR